MPTTSIPSREFNQDVTAAKRAAKKGPVIITDRGRPAYVLLSIDHYRHLAGEPAGNMADILYDPASEDIEFEPPHLGGQLFRPAKLD